jgi:hypothetical protein
MDPLPPPTTTTSGSFHSRQRASRSRSATASQVSSRSASANPDEPHEGSPPHSEIGDDQSASALSRQSTLNSVLAPQRRRLADLDDDSGGGTVVGRPSSPPASVAGDSRPRKRRRLSRAPVRAAQSSPNVLRRSDDPGPSIGTHPLSGASSPRRSGVFATHLPIDVDALSDSPVLGLSDATASSDRAEGSSKAQIKIEASDEDGTLFPQVLSPSDPVPPPSRKHPEPFSAYVCPICLSPPSYPTVTPCGHLCCGECLFSAVKSTIERSAYHGPVSQRAK